MRDPDATAVALALTDAPLVAATGGRIYGGDAPPVGFNPQAETAVCLKSRGGLVTYAELVEASIQAKCYGPTPPEAWDTYQALHAALQGASSGAVTYALAETTGQQLTEPSTGRVFILAYYKLFIRPAEVG